MRHVFRRALAGACAALFANAVVVTAPASAQQAYRAVGDYMVTAANYCPVGTYMAAGQLLSIRGNEALFQALGTRYGGDGQESFALPDRTGQYLTYCIIATDSPYQRELLFLPPPVQIERYVGEIMTAGGQCPDGTFEADGRLLTIIGYKTQLYTVLGMRYGGVRAKTFALPDLRGTGQTYCVISHGMFPSRG